MIDLDPACIVSSYRSKAQVTASGRLDVLSITRRGMLTLRSDSPTWNLDTHIVQCSTGKSQKQKRALGDCLSNEHLRCSFAILYWIHRCERNLTATSSKALNVGGDAKHAMPVLDWFKAEVGLDRDRDTSSGLIPVRGLSALFLTSFRPFCEKLTPWSTSHQQRQWSPTQHHSLVFEWFQCHWFPSFCTNMQMDVGYKRKTWLALRKLQGPVLSLGGCLRYAWSFDSQAAGDNQAIRLVARDVFFEAELLTRVFFITILHDTNLA